jgi:NADH-quinone oxidoreductase subunit L
MLESPEKLVLWVIPLAPLAAAIITALLGPKMLRQQSHLPCWFALAVSAVCSMVLLFSIMPQHYASHTDLAPITTGYEWINIGGMDIEITLRADAMTAIMLAMVTSVSLLVAVFAAGYMHGDPGYPRFFAAVSLFVFSMCMLVLSANFLLMFVFWEGVGFCSYLLIGFWYRRPSAAAAAVKAFVVNRIGDFGFLIGIFLIWTTFGSLDFADTLDRGERFTAVAAMNPGLITGICLLLFLGAMGKSAQFPLHVWLPDAMEGPTPVSALIHAATMVTAGVYMVARCAPLFVNAPTAYLVVSGIGAVTALLAALIAITQYDLKRMLAYSTVSQLGYMFMALGAGAVGLEAATHATTAAMFHLFTHAFFKALLFLAAGSVMHSMGDVIDMRRFGGLRKALPITSWTFLAGTVALAGLPIFSGFWSKDDILAVLQSASHHEKYGTYFFVIFIVAAVTALITAFYSFRAYFLTFHGPEKFPEEAGHHPHDAPPVMAWPLRTLAVAALFIGAAVGPTHWFAHQLSHAIGLAQAESHGFHVPLMIASALIALAGLALAWWLYIRSPQLPGELAEVARPFYLASLNKFYLDELFWAVIVAPTRGLAWFSDWVDRTIIDPAVDAVASIPRGLSRIPRFVHNGLVPSYALVMWAGLIVCLWFALHMF